MTRARSASGQCMGTRVRTPLGDYQFVARGIAGALTAVGAGSTYRQAALVARERARRLRPDPETGELRLTRHGQLVMDWVELFAPVVFEAHRPVAWPARRLVAARRSAVSRALTPRPVVRRSRSRSSAPSASSSDAPSSGAFRRFPRPSKPTGRRSCEALRARRSASSCDNDAGLNAAARAAFPAADLYLCEWHLRHALERLMDKIARTEPQHRETIRGAPTTCPGCVHRPVVLASRSSATLTPPTSRGSRRWLDGTGRIVEDQFARRGLRGTRPPDTPLSTSPMDGLIHPIRDALHPRRYGLKNQERTNRLLMLMQLHANRQDDQQVYATDIRAWLQANNGRPRGARRAITDDRGQPSLR